MTGPGPAGPATNPPSNDDRAVQAGDELPDDLVPSAARGKYSVPDNARRRRPAIVFMVFAAVSGALWLTKANGGVLVNDGFAYAAIVFMLLGAYFLASSKRVNVWEDEAIATAKRGTALAGASGRAQLAWRGLVGRPVWRVLLHDESQPVVRRGVVIVDATDGSVVEKLTEDLPADESGADATAQ
ncbi:MAG: hypothetical protein KY395_00640 [Actinobacteria bacterium]|nr:hypothetical protein [Actinomycetota bacterium]